MSTTPQFALAKKPLETGKDTKTTQDNLNIAQIEAEIDKMQKQLKDLEASKEYEQAKATYKKLDIEVIHARKSSSINKERISVFTAQIKAIEDQNQKFREAYPEIDSNLDDDKVRAEMLDKKGKDYTAHCCIKKIEYKGNAKKISVTKELSEELSRENEKFDAVIKQFDAVKPIVDQYKQLLEKLRVTRKAKSRLLQNELPAANAAESDPNKLKANKLG